MRTKQTNRSGFRLTSTPAMATPNLRGQNSSLISLSPLDQTAFLCQSRWCVRNRNFDSKPPVEHEFGRYANDMQTTRQDGHLSEHKQIMCWWGIHLRLLSRRQLYQVLPRRRCTCAIPNDLQATKEDLCLPKHKQFVRGWGLYLRVLSRGRVHPVLP